MSAAELRVPMPIWAPPPRGLLAFVSGASAPADLRGLLRFSVPVGVSAADLSAPALDHLLAQAVLPLVRVFVDSGAFGEVEMAGGRPVVVAPIDEAAWSARVAIGLQVARAFGDRALIVAPDRVGDQRETLARLRRWAHEMGDVRAAGARVVVPLQRGVLATADFEREAADTLGFSDFVAGIPGNKDAMPPVELERYLIARHPAALHLLGVGPRSPRLQPLLDLCRRIVPGAALSCDSNALAALVGHSNGRGGGPRPLTEAQRVLGSELGSERAREDAVAMVFGPSHLLALAMAEYERLGLAEAPPPRPVQLGLFDTEAA